MKKNEEKKERVPPENFWKRLTDTYFSFYRKHFKDDDGYPLSPDWSPQKIGMEAGALKKIITFLRQIAEGKKIDWTEEYASYQLERFLEKAYNDQFIKRNFYCAMLNKKKVDILVSTYNPALAKKILEMWYFDFPGYARDYDKDKAGAEIIIGFMKQQYLLASKEFTEESVLGSIRLIFLTVKDDEWWCKKSLKSISNNLQEFVNKIKANKNGRNNNTGSTKAAPVVTIKPKGGFGNL
jgi:hypothetical protein